MSKKTTKKIKIAINGFGRIGKMAFKIIFEKYRDQLQVVAINDPNSSEMAAQTLKFDSVYGAFNHKVSYDTQNLIIDKIKTPKICELDPERLPWKKYQVDIVLECTGVFREKQKAAKHLQAGAKVVIISAPAKGKDPVGTYVMGVNHYQLNSKKEQIISNASCTTNCIAPIMQILEEKFGVEKALMTTVHAYTADQNLVDGNHKDPRRARTAGLNIIPTSTGAARATTKTIPSLKGKFDGMAFRVPIAVGSVSDITALLKRNTTKEEINKILTHASQTKKYQGILTVSNDPIVSSDIIHNPASAIVDVELTNVVMGNLIKVVAWYDNEYGYSCRLVEQALEVGKDLI